MCNFNPLSTLNKSLFNWNLTHLVCSMIFQWVWPLCKIVVCYLINFKWIPSFIRSTSVATNQTSDWIIKGDRKCIFSSAHCSNRISISADWVGVLVCFLLLRHFGALAMELLNFRINWFALWHYWVVIND